MRCGTFPEQMTEMTEKQKVPYDTWRSGKGLRSVD